jgi:hypothetical protein
MKLRRIVIDLGIFPPVAEVTRKAVEDGETVAEEDTEAPCWFPVVLVNLW